MKKEGLGLDFMGFGVFWVEVGNVRFRVGKYGDLLLYCLLKCKL